MACATILSDSFTETSSPESSPRNPRICSDFPANAGHNKGAEVGRFPSSEALRGVAQLGSAPALGAGRTYGLTWSDAVVGRVFPPIHPTDCSGARPNLPIAPAWTATSTTTCRRAPKSNNAIVVTNESRPPSGSEFATARAIAARWSCHVDTVYSRLAKAGIAEFRFSSRFIRWQWVDILAFEQASMTVPGQSPHSTERAPLPPSRKRGPQGSAPSRETARG